jgi:predicted AAA+ superfamily ATPase
MSEYSVGYRACGELLRARLGEAAPGRIQLLVGPRQVGKTTLLQELEGELDALYLSGDSPEAAVPGSWERLWAGVEERARATGRAVVLLDEAPHFHRWAERLKGEWDRLRRKRLAVQVVATGSSALHLGAGSRESLAGRFEKLTLRHWTAGDLTAAFGGTAEAEAEKLVQFGGYPGAHALRRDLRRWTAYVREAIVEPAIGRDLLALAPVRRPALLRQVFAVAAASPAQIVSLQKLQGQLQQAGALETISHYLRLLQDAWLVAPLEKWSDTAHRRRAAPPKLVVLDNALLSAADPRGPPARGDSRHGAWVENACLAHAWNDGQRVAYWREEPLEVDAILEGSWGAWAVEVKTGRVDPAELRGLLEFTRRQPRFKPLVLCDPGQERAIARLGIAALAWPRFLVEGPAERGRQE